MKLDTLILLAVTGAGLYFMARTLQSAVASAAPRAPASSLNNYGNLPMVNGGGFRNLPEYLVNDVYKAPYDPYYGL